MWRMQGRRGMALAAALLTVGAAYPALGPRLVARDPGQVLRSSGWMSAHPAGEEERVRRVVEAFFTGFNTMVLEGEGPWVQDRCEALGPLYKPFCFEGSAAGYLPRGYFRWGYGVARAEEALGSMDPDHRLLHYVGLGVWGGLRDGYGHEAASRIADEIRDRRHRSLVWNGFGFARAALRQEEGEPASGLAPCRKLDTEDGLPCAHGYGRGLWFRYLGDEESGLLACGPAADPLSDACITGIGLASAFVRPDRLDRVLETGERLAPMQREAFLRGAQAALLVRHQSDAHFLETSIGTLAPPRRDEVRQLLATALACYRNTIERATFYDDFMACR